MSNGEAIKQRQVRKDILQGGMSHESAEGGLGVDGLPYLEPLHMFWRQWKDTELQISWSIRSSPGLTKLYLQLWCLFLGQTATKKQALG